MKNAKSLYHGYRFPAAVISCAVRWYFRFQLSLRDIEELLFERGVVFSYETVRRWADQFGARFAHRVKDARRKPDTTWHLDEVFVTLRGEPYLLWRAVDQHGAELDILLQKRRDACVASAKPERTQAFLSSFGPIRQHFALKRHLLRASLYRKQLAARFATWHCFTEATQNPPVF